MVEVLQIFFGVFASTLAAYLLKCFFYWQPTWNLLAYMPARFCTFFLLHRDQRDMYKAGLRRRGRLQ